MFTSIVFSGIHKVNKVEAEGISEFIIKGDIEPAVWVFEEEGIYAKPVRLAEPHEKAALFDQLGLPQVGVLPVLKTSLWFCLPLNANQYYKHVRVKAPLPLFFAPSGISVFDPLYARVYKHRRTLLIFEDYHDRYPKEKTDYLRQMLERWMKSAVKVQSYEAGYPRELIHAFQIAKEAHVPPLERLVKGSLRIVQAEFLSLSDQGGGQYQVTYRYKGREDSVLIDDSLFVLDARICLSGREHEQDLSSIVLIKERAKQQEEY